MSEPAADEYTIGWICALQEEFEAACRMLDNEFDSLDAADPKDDNTYVFGRIHQHNIVIGCLPSGIYGTTSAAYVARDMVRSFPSLRFALMVGIGGGAPTPERDIRLGDVVVSEPKGEIGGVVQYDLGKRMSDGVMKRTGQLNAPPRVLLSAFPEVRRRHNDPRKSHFMVENMARMDDMPNYSRPAADKLYHTSSRHQGHKACEGCDPKGVVERSTRPSERAIAIHYGTIASGNTVMKDAAERDRYANDPALNVLCFEMEAAGLMNDFPCLVIRGICDYSDDHKNDEWHNYAALTAAAYARDLLGVVRPQKVASQPAWTGKIATVLSEINQGVKKVVHHQGMKDDEDLLRWLSPIDHAKTQMDKARGPSPGTKAGQWLLDSPEFHDWLNTGKKTLFCPGIPGAGKTVLVSTLVNYLLGRQEHGDGNQARRIGVAFIYLDFKQPFELVHFVGSILRQLAANDPSALDSIHQLHNRCHNGLREPSLSEIREILHSIVPGFSRLFIIVDALDEGEQQLCHGLLSEIFDLQRDHGVNVFATSRHIPNIEKRFSGDRLLEIRASDEDVRNYVDSYMAKLPGFVSRSPELQEEARSGIVKAVDGMFLLARFHLDSLIGTRSVRAFREAIECLPTGKQACDYAYDLALERIEGQVQNKRALAIEVLSWVVCAKYHLTTLQLQHALAVIPGSPHFDASNIPEIEDIVSVCAGLVVVDRERDIVRLVHHTAQEYFDRSQKQRLPDAQSYITNVCLTYLSLDSFQEEAWLKNKLLRDRVRGMPFYSYAAMNWGYHAHESALLPPAVLEFLKCPRKIGGSGQVLVHSTWTEATYYHGLEIGIIGLHLASYFGIVEAVRLLADQSCINWKDRYGRTPLSWAICNGQVEVVAYLLGTGLVDSEPRDSRSRTPLHLAAEKGHPDSMILLLMGGDVNVNTCDDEGDTPLHLAVEEGHEAVVKILLDYGADLNIYNKAEVRPLTRAVRRNNIAIVKQLLNKDPAGLDSTDNPGAGPLLADAVAADSMAVVKLLIDEYKVDINSKNEQGQNSLSVALRRGHKEVAELLLVDGRIDCVSADVDGRTPLSWATEGHDLATVKYLLAQENVDINSRDKKGYSPLTWAAIKGNAAVTRLLLKAGADICCRDDSGRTPLWRVSDEMRLTAEKIEIVREDMSNTDRWMRRAHQYWWSTPTRLKLEMEHGINLAPYQRANSWKWDTNYKYDTEYRYTNIAEPPLDEKRILVLRLRRYLLRQGQFRIISGLLVKNGADVEVEDGNGCKLQLYQEAEEAESQSQFQIHAWDDCDIVWACRNWWE